jgi:RHS repeat-associated protein
MRHIALLTTILILATFYSGYGQANGPDQNMINYSYINSNLKVPASPQAASFANYSNNFNLNHYTGTANVNIPLFEIGQGSVKLPVSIGYSASGNKVDDLAGWVGVGWNLNVGGVITRTVIGQPDMSNNYFNVSYPWDTNPVTDPNDINERNFVKEVANGNIETKPDIFTYTFGGKSGQFSYKKDNQIIYNRKDYLNFIQGPFNSSSGNLDQSVIIIKDENGYTYTFSATENTSYQFETVDGWPDGGPTYTANYISAWYLTEIASPYPAEGKINLSYYTLPTAQITFTNPDGLNTMTFRVGGTTSCCVTDAYPSTVISDFMNQSITNRKIISQAWFTRNNVVFEKLDFLSSPNLASNNHGTYKIDKIAHTNYVPVSNEDKSYEFSYVNNNRLVLSSLTEKGLNNSAAPPYNFEYNSNSIQDPYTNGVDFWGYPNGSSGMIHPDCSSPTFYNGNRYPNAGSFNGILTKVTYPTGGYTSYTYEPHEVQPYDVSSCTTNPLTGQAYTKVGGARISKIEHFTKDNVLANKREYIYTLNGSSSGKLLQSLSLRNISNFITEINPACNNYNTCEMNSNCTTVTLTPNVVSNNAHWQQGPVGYSRVEEIYSANDNSGQTSGKDVYTYYNEAYSTNLHQRNGEVLKVEKFNSSGNLVQETTNIYYLDNSTNNINNYYELNARAETQQSDYILRCFTGSGYIWEPPFDCPVSPPCVASGLFQTRMQRHYIGFKTIENYLTTTYTTTYPSNASPSDVTNANGSFSRTRYEYNYPFALVPTSIYRFFSKTNGKSPGASYYRDEMIYPTAGLLFDKGVYTTPLTVKKYLFNAGSTETLLYSYNNIFTNSSLSNVTLSKVQDAFGNGAFSDLEEFLYDNRNRIVEFKKTHDVLTSVKYLDETNLQTMIAKNASKDRIFYTSFENNYLNYSSTHSDVGWVWSGTVSYTNKAGATGHGYLTLGAGHIKTYTNVLSGRYVVSYYTKNPASITISGIGGASVTLLGTSLSKLNANGWYQIERQIDVNNSVGQVQLSGVGAQIDEIRMYPANALVTTYSYDNSLNLISMADESGKITRFEYDNLHRLVGVYDHNDHLLTSSSYEYHSTTFNQNTLINKLIQTSGVTSVAAANGLLGSNVVNSFSYFDGLGRKIQDVMQDYSPTGLDVVSFYKYDKFNKSSESYLPYTISNNATTYSGMYRPSSIAEQNTFYNTLYPTEGSSAKQTANLEFAPLNRSLGATAEGAAWVNRPRTVSYQLNVDNEVRIADVANGYYGKTRLSKTITTDEDGKVSTTYTDELGRKVMEKADNLMTYYLYTDVGKIKQVIQPEGSVLLHSNIANVASTPDILRQSFEYIYDNEYRLIEKKVPGTTGSYKYAYDRLDRVVMITDPNGFKTYTKYDALSRPIMTGKYTGVALGPTGTEALYETKSSSAATHYYTASSSFPTASTETYSVTYYDGYNHDMGSDLIDDVSYQPSPTYTPSNFSASMIASTAASMVNPFVRGKLTRTKVGVLNTAGTAPTVFTIGDNFYDRYGRVLQTHLTHPYGNKDVTWTDYNFQGWPLSEATEHKATVQGSTKHYLVKDRKTYDHVGRVINSYHQINANPEQLVSTLTYTELDQVKTDAIGGAIQTVDYKYNIRGWLTDINDVANCNNDLFRMRVNYNIGNANAAINVPAYFNGNVSNVEWQMGNACAVGTSRNRAVYGFTYDNNNRLLQSRYGEVPNGQSTYTNIGMYNETYTYNGNSDIVTIQRNGYNAGVITQIDNLNLLHATTGTRRMSHVNEYSSGNLTLGYKATGSLSAYTYDSNGNVTAKTSSTYGSYQYNYLNLPSKIATSASSNTNFIENRYDASGKKWEANANGVVTTYIGSFIYEGTNLTAVYTMNGRVVPVGSNWEYQYYLKDNLGSNRVLFKAGPTIVEEFHNYAYGMNMDGVWSSGTDRYKYTGKELIKGAGLNWYDFGARYMDPSLGRFMQVDPLAENSISMTAYHYAAGNPIRNIDPDGMDWVDSQKSKGKVGTNSTDVDRMIVKHQKEKKEKEANDQINKGVQSAFNTFENNETIKAIHLVFEKFTKTIYDNTVKILKKNPELSILHYEKDESRKIKNRDEATKSYKTIDGFQRDEFPYACTKEGGCGAFINYVPTIENRLQGGQLSILSRVLGDGDAFLVQPVPNSENPIDFIPIAMRKLATTETKKMAGSRVVSMLGRGIQSLGGRAAIFLSALIYTGPGGVNFENEKYGGGN